MIGTLLHCGRNHTRQIPCMHVITVATSDHNQPNSDTDFFVTNNKKSVYYFANIVITKICNRRRPNGKRLWRILIWILCNGLWKMSEYLHKNDMLRNNGNYCTIKLYDDASLFIGLYHVSYMATLSSLPSYKYPQFSNRFVSCVTRIYCTIKELIWSVQCIFSNP